MVPEGKKGSASIANAAEEWFMTSCAEERLTCVCKGLSVCFVLFFPKYPSGEVGPISSRMRKDRHARTIPKTNASRSNCGSHQKFQDMYFEARNIFLFSSKLRN
jgi:hypothetical protein